MMKITSKDFRVKLWCLDLLCVIVVIVLNPITYSFTRSPRIFQPDTIAYITMGTDLFHKGLVYIPSWGHIDIGLILPPLYPFLIACGNLFSEECLKLAEYISCGCMSLASITIFLYLKRVTNRIIAILTVILIQINYLYFCIGMMPLSESSFFLTASFTLLLIVKLYNGKHFNGGLALTVGLSSALVFFARQIGITVFIFLTIWSWLQFLIGNRESRTIFIRNLVFVWIGFLVLVIPYILVLFHQTGQILHKQAFRTGKYVVNLIDARPLSKLARLQETKKNTYGQVYYERRVMRKLLPDASEMICCLYQQKNDLNKRLKQLTSVFQNPTEYFSKLINNIMLLKKPLGVFLFYLFLVLCISPFVVKSNRVKFSTRLLLPSFIIFYLAIVSCFTDIVGRYVYIVFPFVLVHITAEVFVLFKDWIKIERKTIIVFFGLFFLSAFFLTPNYFYEFKVYPKFSEKRNPYQMCKKYIKHGEPVFGLLPVLSYLAGGTYRILPNDSLEKVVKYGKKTGVRWLIIDRTRVSSDERLLYNNAQWYWNSSIENDFPNLVRLCYKTLDGSIALYKIL